MSKTIYFHVGMSKTGSTFLQQRVFPKFQNITYLPTNQFLKYEQRVQKNEDQSVLLSREFDSQMEREVSKWAEKHPQTKAILVLRSPESWVASQYRRFTKNGFGLTFTEFIDIKNDNGYWRKDDLFFSKKIQILEHYFESPPLILLYDDLKTDAKSFIKSIASYTNAQVDMNAIDFSPFHKSYDEHQLKVMRKAGKYLYIRHKKPFQNSILNALYKYGFVYPQRYGVLYGAKLLPKSWMNPAPLIPSDELQRIQEYYAEDWKWCVEYAES